MSLHKPLKSVVIENISIANLFLPDSTRKVELPVGSSIALNPIELHSARVDGTEFRKIKLTDGELVTIELANDDNVAMCLKGMLRGVIRLTT